MIYQTNGTSGFYFYDGNIWTKVDGVAGPQGTQGVAGVDGTNGEDGIDGNDGSQGTQGVAGAAGIDGTDGTDGTNGEDGIDGNDGSQGIQGVAGAAGINGTDGADGTNGIDGNDGVQGIQGVAGAAGINGTDGVDGNDGSQGIQGVAGADGVDGTDGTDGTNGIDGQGGVATVGDGLILTGSGTQSDPYLIELPSDGNEGDILTIINGIPTWTCLSPSYTFYQDSDGDGFGSETSISVCENIQPQGYVDNNTDCDDSDASVNPQGVEILDDGIDQNCDGIDSVSKNIGDFAYGGVVFWIDPADNSHGLVCAVSDQSTSEGWDGGNSAIPNAFGINIGTGSLNTDEIISVFGVNGNNYAAKLTYEYNGGGYDDWFLPSLQELNEILANKTIVNSTCTSNGGTSLSEVDWYWSSSVGTADNNRVWEVDMSNGNNAEALRGGNNNIVRAVRAF